MHPPWLEVVAGPERALIGEDAAMREFFRAASSSGFNDLNNVSALDPSHMPIKIAPARGESPRLVKPPCKWLLPRKASTRIRDAKLSRASSNSELNICNTTTARECHTMSLAHTVDGSISHHNIPIDSEPDDD